jgi:alpha-mannosidase
MRTVHIILNAHLDPIWLWSWRDGLDEVLNTSHTICNLLDRHSDIVYTRGEAWVYEQIRKLDPALFSRIQAHVHGGRWATVGGWYIQPDCNLPSGFAMERQIALGARLFADYFGPIPQVAYNVDTFGHAASLPGLMRCAGQHSYVMMRPQEHEMALPSRLFRWRGYADGPEVTTFRIAKTYCSNITTPEALEEHLQACLTELPPGIDQTMCFVGIGDHGGGPTDELIAWCRANATRPDCRLIFSSPDRFFAALQPDLDKLPVVTGELQPHAVGCYSVFRPAKTLLKKAEYRLAGADFAAKDMPDAFATDLEKAWSQVCFHHFHDTLGGTCLPSAYHDVTEQLGRALAIGDEILTTTLRRRVVQMPGAPHQRLLFWNTAEEIFDDFLEIEPWLEWTKWQEGWGLVDEQGSMVPHQVMDAESAGANETRLLLSLRIAPGAIRAISLVDLRGRSSSIETKPEEIPARAHIILDGKNPGLNWPGIVRLPLPRFRVYEDTTDTWSHGVHRFERRNPVDAAWEGSAPIDEGPLMTSRVQTGRLGASRIQAEWRTYRDRPWIDLLLRVLWMERWRILKLEWNLPEGFVEREDGILGGSLLRPRDGKEYPLRDWTVLRNSSSGHSVAVIAPDVFGLDADASQLGLTLLRSCPLACHEPNPGSHPRTIFSDQGEHFFRFRFLAAPSLSADELDRIALGLNHPPSTATTTRGMPGRAGWGDYLP